MLPPIDVADEPSLKKVLPPIEVPLSPFEQKKLPPTDVHESARATEDVAKKQMQLNTFNGIFIKSPRYSNSIKETCVPKIYNIEFSKLS